MWVSGTKTQATVIYIFKRMLSQATMEPSSNRSTVTIKIIKPLDRATAPSYTTPGYLTSSGRTTVTRPSVETVSQPNLDTVNLGSCFPFCLVVYIFRKDDDQGRVCL